MSAPTFATGGASSFTSANTRSVGLAGLTVGQLIIVYACAPNVGVTATIADSQSNSYTQLIADTAGPTQYVWYTVVTTPGSPNITVNFSATIAVTMHAVVYSGTTGKVNQVTRATGTSTSPAPGMIADNLNYQKIIAFLGCSPGATVTNPPGWTQREQSSSVPSRTIDNVNVPGQSQPIWTLSTVQNWGAVVLDVSSVPTAFAMPRARGPLALPR